MVRKTRTDYVDNEKLYKEMVDYKNKVRLSIEQGTEKPRIPEYIGECILKIPTRMSLLSKFRGYSQHYREEMISDAIEDMITYIDNFDEQKYKNPFAYFSQITYYAFTNRLKLETKNRYKKYKLFQKMVLNSSDASLMVDENGNNLLSPSMYDNISVFIQEFEDKEEKRKEKRRQMKTGLEIFVEE